MTVIVPISAFQDNYIWVIVHQDQKTITCIDPGLAEPVLNAMQHAGWTLQNILLTHHHADHIGGVQDLLKKIPTCRVYAPHDTRIRGTTEDVYDQDEIFIDTYTFSILAIPGHTSSHVAYYEPKQHWLFCGDTLFSAGCGRVFDGTLIELYHSLQKLQQLPDQTKIYCGHEYTLKNLSFARSIEPDNSEIIQYQLALQDKSCSLPSTLALEKKVNPFLRTHLPALSSFAKIKGIDVNDYLSIFKCLRSEKDHW